MVNRGYQQSCYETYERIRNPERVLLKAHKIADILKHYVPLHLIDLTCLDIGCSTGIITEVLCDLYPKVVGIEYDHTAISHILDRVKQKASFTQGDGMALPFDDETFDVIICAQIYEHVPDAQTLFNEMYRVLQPGGFVFFSGPNKLYPIEPHYFIPFLHWYPQSLADMVLKVFSKGNHYYEKLYTYWTLKRMLHQFDIQSVTNYVIRHNLKISQSSLLQTLGNITPPSFWEIFTPFVANFNWVLYKPGTLLETSS